VGERTLTREISLWNAGEEGPPKLEEEAGGVKKKPHQVCGVPGAGRKGGLFSLAEVRKAEERKENTYLGNLPGEKGQVMSGYPMRDHPKCNY